MLISKNKKYQYFFFLILSILIIFNGGNSNLFIQVNFIIISLFFLFCLKDKNYNLHLKNFFIRNKNSIFIYFIFLIFLIFQIIPLPINFLKFFSPEKFLLLNSLEDISYSSISVSPINSFFQILNFVTLLVIVFISSMIFYNRSHKYRFYFFLSISGFFVSTTAILFYLIGNPDILFIKNSFYKNASTGFFVNRTVFSIFLLICLVASLELLKNLNSNSSVSKNKNFFNQIYIRLFILFITIGIITSFSRISNFLLMITVLFYYVKEIFISKNDNSTFKITLLLIIIFDLIILGNYFGKHEIISRFFFLKEEFSTIPGSIKSLSRFDLMKFGTTQIKPFLFFGYGTGGFENIFKLNFLNSSSHFANHSHSDLVEYIGEFGLIGFLLLILSFLKFFLLKKNYNFVNSLLIFYLIIIIIFDFSLHVPIIQILFLNIFLLNKKIIH